MNLTVRTQLIAQAAFSIGLLLLGGFAVWSASAVLTNVRGVFSYLVGGVLLLLSANFIILGFLLAAWTLSEAFTRKWANPDGLVVRRFGKARIFKWNRLSAIRRASLCDGLPVLFGLNGLYDRMQLEFAEDKSVSVGPSCAEKHLIASTAEEAFWSANRDVLIELVKNGESLDFKAVSLSAGGLTRQDRTLPWNVVREISPGGAGSILIILKDGSHQTLAVEKMVNPGMFLRLARHWLEFTES